ncbi:MAG: excinuclease ABC subunit UvrA, partial [Bdellovibrio sp.]
LVEIEDPVLKKSGLPQQAFVVIDRLQFRREEGARLADSMAQAYEASRRFNSSSVAKALVHCVDGASLNFSEEDSCPECDFVAPRLSTRLFSFNSPAGACPHCKGFGNILALDEAKIVPNPSLSLEKNALQIFAMPSSASERRRLLAACKKKGISTLTPWRDLPAEHREILWKGDRDLMGVEGFFQMLEGMKYKMHVRVFISRYRSPRLCSDCGGTRLRKEASQVLVHGKSIGELCRMQVQELREWMQITHWTPSEKKIAAEVFRQISGRLDFLERVGVHYLQLDRETKTLSGGEFQRIKLAHQLGMGLSQSLYVLDEPTVGLHPRDNRRLISVLKDLKNLGNTLVVVEHDRDVLEAAEHILEIGPGSGSRGGELVFQGSFGELLTSSHSVTAPFLRPQGKKNSSPLDPGKPRLSKTVSERRLSGKAQLELRGARGHNLKNVNLRLPLHQLVAVTGVSGSGKSTLITKTLYPALASALNVEYLKPEAFDEIKGVEYLQNVVLVDASAVGKSARSSPITYLKAFDGVRQIFSSLLESKARGYSPGSFSLNVDGGRCPSCKGTGVEEIDMQFMDNVVLPCDVCDGKKFQKSLLEVRYQGLNIHEVLSLTVSEAFEFFQDHSSLRKALSQLKAVGLEYLQIGQSAATLSGGESQRLKIARELVQSKQKSCLYILDEPTTGLHFREVEILMKALRSLVENGASVVLIEHNLEVIRQVDHVIDLGPEAGFQGGQILAQGSPEHIAACTQSLTGQFLKEV